MTDTKDIKDTQLTDEQKARNLYVIGMARENLNVVIDQVQSITEDDTYKDVLQALENVKEQFSKVLAS
jgi:hypothetical protein